VGDLGEVFGLVVVFGSRVMRHDPLPLKGSAWWGGQILFFFICGAFLKKRTKSTRPTHPLPLKGSAFWGGQILFHFICGAFLKKRTKSTLTYHALPFRGRGWVGRADFVPFYLCNIS